MLQLRVSAGATVHAFSLALVWLVVWLPNGLLALPWQANSIQRVAARCMSCNYYVVACVIMHVTYEWRESQSGDTLMQASFRPDAKLQHRLRGGVERMLRMSALPTWLNLLLRSASLHLLICPHCRGDTVHTPLTLLASALVKVGVRSSGEVYGLNIILLCCMVHYNKVTACHGGFI